MKPYKLTSEIVPKTCWYSNVRAQVTTAEWDVIRKFSYAKANNVCEICGDTGKNQGYNHNVECHEIWEYTNNKQILKGLIALCPHCHKVKHPGLANMKGESKLVLSHLMKVNKISKADAEYYLSEVFEEWAERSQQDWELDISYLTEFLKEQNDKPWYDKM